MEQSKLYASLIGVCIGSIMGYIISIQLMDRFKSCQALENENRMLREMIFQLQDPYRPDTLK
jgi:hypothetical protein